MAIAHHPSFFWLYSLVTNFETLYNYYSNYLCRLSGLGFDCYFLGCLETAWDGNSNFYLLLYGSELSFLLYG